MSDTITLTRPSDDVSTGLQSDRWFDHGLGGRLITWINWDSPFRRTRLAIGDIVLAMNGISCDARRQEIAEDFVVGSFGESRGWKQAGLGAGAPVRLDVWRDHERFEVEACLAPENFYYDPQGRRALGPGGPDRLASDGLGASWGRWYEDLTKQLSSILCHGWRRDSFNSRQVLRDLLAHEDRIRVLTERYPGPFADVVVADYHAGVEAARGRLWPADAIDLSWREQAGRMAERVREAAEAAERELADSIAPRLVPAQPAPDPIETDPADVAGRIVRLDSVSPRSMRMDAGYPWYVVGDVRSGYWFLDAESPGCRQFHLAMENYRQLVDQRVPEQYRFYAEVLPVPRMMVVDGRTAAGLTLALAAVVADRVFIPVSADGDPGAARFAGEELLKEKGAALPASASPREVVEAAIGALKSGRRDLWEGLFADWHVSSHWNGALTYTPVSFNAPSNFYYEWDFGRGELSKALCDVRVVREGVVETIIAPDAAGGGVHIEECRVEVEHVGLFDGEYRSFKKPRLHRVWTLQRRDGGPWRIRDLHAL